MNKRNASLDLLRIIAMFMILTVHFLGWGGTVNILSTSDFNYYIIIPIYFVSGIGNTLFFMLSGYFLKPPRAEKALFLERKTAFYSFTITLIVFMFGVFGAVESVSVKFLIKSAFPIIFNKYWFISVYIVLYVFSGVLFNGLERLSKRQTLFVIAALMINNTCLTEADMTFMQGLLAYVTGYYLHKYKPFERYSRSKIGIAYVISLAIYVAERFAVQHYNLEHTQFDEGMRYLLLYTCAVLFFSYFAKLNIKSTFPSKVSGNVVAVYLITANPAIMHMLYEKWLHIEQLSFTWWFVLYYLGVNILMFAICILIDKAVTVINLKEAKIWVSSYKKILRYQKGT